MHERLNANLPGADQCITGTRGKIPENTHTRTETGAIYVEYLEER